MSWLKSVAADRHGIPIGWRTAAVDCNDISLLFPTLDAVAGRGLLAEIETLHLDRSYDTRSSNGSFAPSTPTTSTSNGEAPRFPA